MRHAVHINGIVQGVGFRPFVYNLARRRRLTGFVANAADGVEIEAEGATDSLAAFLRDLRQQAPPLAVVSEITYRPIPPVSDETFCIHASNSHRHVSTRIPPDITVCNACLAELFDPADRRYKYPFINCTNCGPRYTIIKNIPYDRSATSMRHFIMCKDCRAEYNDPGNRRFHAQPNCCPICGPLVTLYTPDRTIIAKADEAVRRAVGFLQKEKIVAIKGVGGFHLAVDAASDNAVKRLRHRKGRKGKPFAVMVSNLKTAQRLCELNDDEIQILSSPQAPIILARKRTGHGLCAAIAPRNELFGIMLPSSPLHHLLFNADSDALVMTSGNFSEEPICFRNEEAFERLGGIADYFLMHNRDIYLRSDDSIVIHLTGKMRSIRRSRGYTPRSLAMNIDGPPLLATGGELKNTVCLLKNDQAFISQHLGDLKNPTAYIFFRQTIEHLKRFFETEPELIVHDLHPGYLSTIWSREQKETPTLAVQHHHAHLAGCLAENRIDGPAIGFIMDGAGYGADGTIWGGEVLIGDYRHFERYAHFEPMPLPGGDAAVAAPWRTAVGYLYMTYDGQLPDLPFLTRHDIAPIAEMVAKGVNSPITSSCGRLFDAVAAISGGRQIIQYEAQAAIELMRAAGGKYGRPYPCGLSQVNGCLQLPVRDLVKSVVNDVRKGMSLFLISQRFHQTLIYLFTETARQARQDTGIRTVALSGGVFQNHLLFTGLLSALTEAGFTVATHAQVPGNDGGLSFGQAVIGRHFFVSDHRARIWPQAECLTYP